MPDTLATPISPADAKDFFDSRQSLRQERRACTLIPEDTSILEQPVIGGLEGFFPHKHEHQRALVIMGDEIDE